MQDIHEKAPAEVVKINVGALKGACVKIECEKFYYFQMVNVSCYVPIIAPSFLIKLSGYRCIVLLFLTRMCIFVHCESGKIVACTVKPLNDK